MNPNDSDRLGRPRFSSTPLSSNQRSTGVPQVITPIRRPSIVFPGTFTSRFVHVRRRVTFSRMSGSNPENPVDPPPESENLEDEGNPENVDNDGNPENGDNGHNQENSDEWSPEKLEEAKTWYMQREKIVLEREELENIRKSCIKKLEEDLEFVDKEREELDKQKLEFVKIKIDCQKKQKEIDLEKAEKTRSKSPNVTVRGARPVEPLDHKAHDKSKRASGVDKTINLATQGLMGTPISFIQVTALTPFSSLRGEDPRVFLDKYERLNSAADDRMKVETFGQYLEGPAADWYSVLRNVKQEEVTYAEEGVQSNRWTEMPWEELKRLFELEFAEEKEKEILSLNQGLSETGLTYFYKMIKLHQRSGLNLDEGQLATLLLARMTDPYREKLEGQKFTSLDKLREAIKLFDERRARKLANKRKVSISLIEREAEEHLGENSNSTEEEIETRISVVRKELEEKFNKLENQLKSSEESPRENYNMMGYGRGFNNNYIRGYGRGLNNSYIRSYGIGLNNSYSRGYGRGLNNNYMRGNGRGNAIRYGDNNQGRGYGNRRMNGMRDNRYRANNRSLDGQEQSFPGACYNCNSRGHQLRYCPEPIRKEMKSIMAAPSGQENQAQQ